MTMKGSMSYCVTGGGMDVDDFLEWLRTECHFRLAKPSKLLDRPLQLKQDYPRDFTGTYRMRRIGDKLVITNPDDKAE